MTKVIAVPCKAGRKKLPKGFLKSLVVKDDGPGIPALLKKHGVDDHSLGLSTVITVDQRGAVTGSFFHWHGVLR